MMKNQCNNISSQKSSNGPKSQMDYGLFTNSFSRKMQPSPLREMADIFLTLPDGKVNAANGFPDVSTFPFQNISASLKDGSSLILEGETLYGALQYGSCRGNLDLRDWLKKFQDRIHGPLSWNKYDLILCSGCQEGLSIIASILLENGDAVIMQTPSYPGTLSLLKPKNIEMIPLYTEFEGVKIELLKQILEKRSVSGKSMPKLMIVNPTGGNPCGVTISTEEKLKIYQLACKFNFLIVEDDPYYFLSFSEDNHRSFLSMDSENKVLRLDSFSKIISAGIRLGFITAPREIIAKMLLCIESSTIHPSGLSQVITYELLKQWQFTGFMQHLSEVQMFYKRKRDVTLRSVEKHFKDLVDYTVPSAGFFLWMRLKFIRNSKTFAEKKCIKNLILIAPGCMFYEDDTKMSSYFRISYSSLTDEVIDRVISKLATLIREESSVSDKN